jgi:hypothetical protein
MRCNADVYPPVLEEAMTRGDTHGFTAIEVSLEVVMLGLPHRKRRRK